MRKNSKDYNRERDYDFEYKPNPHKAAKNYSRKGKDANAWKKSLDRNNDEI